MVNETLMRVHYESAFSSSFCFGFGRSEPRSAMRALPRVSFRRGPCGPPTIIFGGPAFGFGGCAQGARPGCQFVAPGFPHGAESNSGTDVSEFCRFGLAVAAGKSLGKYLPKKICCATGNFAKTSP